MNVGNQIAWRVWSITCLLIALSSPGILRAQAQDAGLYVPTPQSIVDAMLGQDAVNTAKTFAETLPLTGIILTKLDGDARGGAALSVRHVTGKPIKFIGVGEKVSGLEPFHPERMASRIGLIADARLRPSVAPVES